jgi:glycosyltransferase involved in cell wall biosynthesis
VFVQEFKDWILFVSDNCSTDGMWEILQQFHHPQQRLCRQPGTGVPGYFMFESSVGRVFTVGNDAVHAKHFCRD